MGSVSHEAIAIQILKQVPPNTGDIDDDGPLTDDATSNTSNEGYKGSNTGSIDNERP